MEMCWGYHALAVRCPNLWSTSWLRESIPPVCLCSLRQTFLHFYICGYICLCVLRIAFFLIAKWFEPTPSHSCLPFQFVQCVVVVEHLRQSSKYYGLFNGISLRCFRTQHFSKWFVFHKVLQINEQFFRGQWSVLGERTATCNQTDNTYLKGDRRSLIYMFTELFELMLWLWKILFPAPVNKACVRDRVIYSDFAPAINGMR